jgi:ankyrin repeat protein
VKAANKDEATALHEAALEGHEQLYQAGAGVRARSKSGSTPLHQAVLGDYLEIVQWLLGLDVEVSVIDDEERTPLYDAASKGYLRYRQRAVPGQS